MAHPKDRPGCWPLTSRREFLTRSGGAALALSAAGPLLAACSNSNSRDPAASSGAEGAGPGGLPLARPDKRVTLPQWRDPIESGLEPETGGDFIIFNYPNYIYEPLLKDFGKKYGVSVKVLPFANINSGITRLASGAIQADVMEMTPDNLDRVVAGKLVAPLNLDYIPNLKKNVWPSLADPFYDAGSHYSVPYTAFCTGLGWRNDHVQEDIPAMENPWDIIWQSQAYKGKVALLDEVRETIALGLLHNDVGDINTEDPEKVNHAVDSLTELYDICNVLLNKPAYDTLPTDKTWLNQTWSGDMIGAYFYFLPKPSVGPLLRFWKPEKGDGPVGNDTWCVTANAKKPVLAHLFLNYMLDNGVAYSNFVNYNGYQPPLTEIDPQQAVGKGLLPETLANCIMTESDLGADSLQLMTLTTAGQQTWQNAYSRFLAGG